MPLPGESASTPETDPEALAKALELELIGQRAAWEKARARRGLWRALSFLFLLLVILGTLLAWFYFPAAMRPKEEVRPGAATRGR